MRISAGYYRGRQVHCPPGLIRPMMERIRESMFSILGDINGKSVLDLFCGSGIITLEAISRGANKALLIEKDIKKRKTLYRNMEIIQSSPQSGTKSINEVQCLFQPAEHLLKQLAQNKNPKRFDLVFLDPPFYHKQKVNLIHLADKALQPAPQGSLILHYPSKDGSFVSTGNLELYDYRQYGHSCLCFFTRKK